MGEGELVNFVLETDKGEGGIGCVGDCCLVIDRE